MDKSLKISPDIYRIIYLEDIIGIISCQQELKFWK